MQIKPAGFWSRGTAMLPPSPHITPDSLVNELKQVWGPRGFDAYKTALLGADVVLKKSGWTGIAIKINHSPQGTTLRFNPFAPSFLVRLLAMGLIPLLIAYYNSWQPLLQEFMAYLQQSPFMNGQMGQGAYPAGQMGQGQMPPQGYGAPQGQPGYGAPQGQPAYGAPQGQPGYGAPQGQPGYGVPQGQPGYGAPQGQPGYGAPQGQPGYGAPQGQPGYGAPQGQPGYGAPPGQQGPGGYGPPR